MAKILAWGVGGLVAVTLAIVALVPDFEVRIPEDEVRDKIEDALPITQNLSDAKLRLSDAEVDFIGTGEKGQVALAAEVKLSGFGLAVTGTVDTVTAIRYEDGAFYLSDLRLADLALEPTLATRAKIAAFQKAIQPLIDEFMAEFRSVEGSDEAIDRIKGDFEKTLVPLVRQGIDDALGTIPVFRLSGDPAKSAARLILKDVVFTDREAIAILSPAQAMIKIASAVVGGLVLLLLGWEWYRAERRVLSARDG